MGWKAYGTLLGAESQVLNLGVRIGAPYGAVKL